MIEETTKLNRKAKRGERRGDRRGEEMNDDKKHWFLECVLLSDSFSSNNNTQIETISIVCRQGQSPRYTVHD